MRRAVADVAVTVGQSLEEGAALCRKRMLAAVAGSVDPPNLPPRVPGGQCMKHGQHRGCADAGTQQDDGAAARSQREAAAWRAHVQNVADPDLSVDVSPSRPMKLSLDAYT